MALFANYTVSPLSTECVPAELAFDMVFRLRPCRQEHDAGDGTVLPQPERIDAERDADEG